MTKVVGVRFRQVGKIYSLHRDSIMLRLVSTLLLKQQEELSMATLFLVKERLRIQQLYSRLRLLSEYRHLMMMKGKLRTGKRKKKRIRYVLRRLRSIILK